MSNTFENILKNKLEEKNKINNSTIVVKNIEPNVYKKMDDIDMQLRISLARDKFLKENTSIMNKSKPIN